MKKAYTLFELLIVIIIIGLLMTITFRFGANQIGRLGWQTEKEQFITIYEELYDQAQRSNYIGNEKYQSIRISLAPDTTGLVYQYTQSGNVEKFFPMQTFSLGQLYIDNAIVDPAYLILYPYQSAVMIQSNNITGDLLQLSLDKDGQSIYCFALHASNGKLVEKDCENRTIVAE